MSHGVPRVSGATTVEKSEQAREKERKQIESYKTLERDVRERIQKQDYTNPTLQLTSRLLTFNPEYYTVWNQRRLILQSVFTHELSDPTPPQDQDDNDISAAQAAGLTPPQHEILLLIKEDLAFLIPLLRSFPKCYWIWNHRSWLLRSATSHLPGHTTLELWRAELGLVGKMLALDSRNFHGWGYRRDVVGEIERLGAAGSSSLVEEEFAYTTRMINTNLSNFSAWHYRSQLLPRLLRERKASADERRKVLEAEFELITRALYTDPYDQSLWFYHQYLMSTFDPSNPCSETLLESCSDAGRAEYLQREIESVKDMLDGAEDCKYIYQALLEYSLRHLELDAGKEKVEAGETRAWLEELRKLDPLREARWRDMEMKIPLS